MPWVSQEDVTQEGFEEAAGTMKGAGSVWTSWDKWKEVELLLYGHGCFHYGALRKRSNLCCTIWKPLATGGS